MMGRNYIIAFGGSGSRCLEAFIYLLAAGLTQDPIYSLIIDPDLNNGDGFKAREVANFYHDLYLAQQPIHTNTKGIFNLWPTRLPEPIFFQAPLNQRQDKSQLPISWYNPNSPLLKFSDTIKYKEQPDDIKDFINLFYEPNDLGMQLNVGYQGRSHVGAVILKQSLEESVAIPGSGLHEFATILLDDLKSGAARIFVFGSVFGGTGSAGLPIIPSFFHGLIGEELGYGRTTRVHLGCAMMTPYSYIGARDRRENIYDRHILATQTALMHYARVPPGYQHIYLIGAPELSHTQNEKAIGGQSQRNAPHYAELVAALAAIDFFSLPMIQSDAHNLHFADTTEHGREVGINWDTIPINPDFREEAKQKIVSFTTLAYTYRHFFYKGFVNNKDYRQAIWYRNNFERLSLDNEAAQLNILYNFLNSYLLWLRDVGETAQHNGPGLINCQALSVEDKRKSAQFVGSLLPAAMHNPKYVDKGFDPILERLNSVKLNNPMTESPSGLFIYLLQHAVSGFCRTNYSWKT